jgi:cytochrome c-type biogenesis protein
MTPIDLAFGLLAGMVSCLTPAAVLLFPLALGAAGASGRAGKIAPALGLGLAFVVTGIVAGSLGIFGLDATSFRRIVCGLLVLLAIVLMSVSMVNRFPRLTGGHGNVFGVRGATQLGGAFRLILLTLFVGANWVPLMGPTLGRASLMAADIWNSGLALAVLFVFGVGAAMPWIVLGRIIRFLARPFGGVVPHAMASKRLLALSLLAVAILGSTGLDIAMAHRIDGLTPAWTRKLAISF